MGTTPTILRNATDASVLQLYPTRNSSNVTRHGVQGSPAGRQIESFYYFALPFPKGVQILSATLTLRQVANYVGSVTITAGRANTTWSASRVTWNTRPGTIGSSGVALTKSSPVAGTSWQFNVAAQLQLISTGGQPWYGFKITGTPSSNFQMHSSLASLMDYRPTLSITWSDAPRTPSKLYPSAGRAVSVAKPVVSCDFIDVSGDTTMQAMRVQINGTNDFSAPAFDSGTVLTSTPSLDLSTTAWAGLATDGALAWWRVQVQDGSGLWSGWSVPTSFVRRLRATLTLNNPALGSLLRTNLGWSRSATNWYKVGTNIGTPTLATTAAPDGGGAITSTMAAAVTTGTVGFGTTSMAVTAGTPYSAYMKARVSGTGGKRAQLKIEWYTSLDVLISSSTGPVVELDSTTFQVVPLQGAVAPATAAKAKVMIDFGSNTVAFATSEVLTLAHLMFEQEVYSDPAMFFDGLTPANTAYTYAWTGTAGASTSTVTGASTGDSTPPIDWTFAGNGRIQKAYQVVISDADTGNNWLWSSGKITSTATAMTIPAGVIKTNYEDYQVQLTVWDDIDREATPGDPIPSFVARTFMYAYDGTVAAATNLVGELDPYFPWMKLSWSRSTQPDGWDILRNGKVIYSGSGDSLLVPGTTTNYAVLDGLIPPRSTSVWQVVAVVNGKGSANSPSITATVVAKTVVLSRSDGMYPVMIWNKNVDMALNEISGVFSPAGNGAPIIITQAERGYQGKISGRLAGIGKYSSADQKYNFQQLTKNRGLKLRLTVVDDAFECIIANPNIFPVAKNEEVVYQVSFDFYQTDYIP